MTETLKTESPAEFELAELARLGAKRKRLIKQLEEIDDALKLRIAEARAADTPYATITRLTGIKSREQLRVIARSAGVEAPATWVKTRRP